MQDSNLLLRDDTLFGICQALGDDFGFDPLYLRVALAVSLLLNPMAVVGAYAAAGILVLFSRLLAPNPRLRLSEPAAAAEREQEDAEPLPLAA